jgi:mono/diheme cytochrome c family protein
MSVFFLTKRTFVWSALLFVLGLGGRLVQEMRLEAQTPRRAPAPTATATPDRLAAATRQFRQYCARCHGEDKTGRPWSERGRRIPDFTNGPWHDSRTDSQLFVSILEGKGARMPSFNDRLSKEQVRDLVLLIRNANATRPIAAEGGPTDFAQRYVELRAELDELRKQFRELDSDSRKRAGVGRRSVTFPPIREPNAPRIALLPDRAPP